LTWPAVPPHVALRILRTAAGRRALQVALLVGGLFALGFLCGGQASAAEDVPTAPTTSSHTAVADVDGVRSLSGGVVGRLVKPPAEPDVHHSVDDTGADTNTGSTPSGSEGGGALTDALDSLGGGDGSNRLSELLPPPVKDVEEQVLRPVTEQLVGVVDGEVLQPVGDLVETVTEQLDEAQSKLPLLPSLPEEPSLPGLPGLPTAPGLPELPVQTLPDTTLPDTTVPVTTVPQPESPVAGSPDGDDSGKQSGRTAATAVFYGPPSVAGSPTTGTAAQTGGQRAAQAAHTPVQQAPADDPGGAPGNRSAADGGSSRHVDAHAVSLNHRAPLRLVAGAAARTDAAGTRDRHQDIPVSPA
jgi:hypothetical protein